MKKPKEIVALEKVYDIQLERTLEKDNIISGEKRNLFFTDKKNKVLGLNLSGNKIENIDGFENLRDLIYLNLSKNSLTVLDNFENLPKLQILILSFNKIVKMTEISLPYLKTLNLTHNYITKIKGFEKLENLEELYLTQNGIKMIESFDHLKSLKILKIDFNYLTEVDFQLFSNCNLIFLDLRNNWIVDIKNIEIMKEIQHLNLKYNKINKLDLVEKTLTLRNLNFINVEGNPFLEKTDLDLYGYGYENHLEDLCKYFNSQC